MATVLDVLDRHGVTARPTGKASEFIVTCPVCAKPKLYVNTEKRLWVCYVCGDGGQMRRLFELFGIDNREELKPDLNSLRKEAEAKYAKMTGATPEAEDAVVTHALPSEYKPIVPGSAMFMVGQQMYQYLINRGMTDAQILDWKIGYCATGDYAGCCIVPVFDAAGAVVTFQGRRVVGVGSKNKNPMGGGGFMFNIDHAQRHAGIVVVEGPFDAMALHTKLSPYNISSLALLRHSISAEQASYIGRVMRPKVTWVGLDPDIDLNYMHKVGKVLRSNGCTEVLIAQFPRDPDELTLEELSTCLDAAEHCR